MVIGRKQFVGGMSGALAIALALAWAERARAAAVVAAAGRRRSAAPERAATATSASGRRRPFRCTTRARLHDLALTMSADDWQSIIDDSRGDEWRHASVTYDGVVVDDVGVRPAGESSRFAGNQKMSIRIKFDAFDGNGKFGGYGDVNVKGEYDDGSMMRERLAFFVFGALMPAPKAAHATLTVNGDLARPVHAARGLGRDVDLRAFLPAGRSALPDPAGRSSPPIPTRTSATIPPATFRCPGSATSRRRRAGDEVVPPFLKAMPDYVDTGAVRRRRQSARLPRRRRDRDDHRRPDRQHAAHPTTSSTSIRSRGSSSCCPGIPTTRSARRARCRTSRSIRSWAGTR